MLITKKVNNMNMESEAYCHECGETAKGRDVVSERFGFRLYQGKEYVQSWCRKCRNRQQRERRLSNKSKQLDVI